MPAACTERTELTPEEVELFGEDIKRRSTVKYSISKLKIGINLDAHYQELPPLLQLVSLTWLLEITMAQMDALPASYREVIGDYCVNYGLFSRDAYVGGIETDISTILTYSAVEKWLEWAVDWGS